MNNETAETEETKTKTDRELLLDMDWTIAMRVAQSVAISRGAGEMAEEIDRIIHERRPNGRAEEDIKTGPG